MNKKLIKKIKGGNMKQKIKREIEEIQKEKIRNTNLREKIKNEFFKMLNEYNITQGKEISDIVIDVKNKDIYWGITTEGLRFFSYDDEEYDLGYLQEILDTDDIIELLQKLEESLKNIKQKLKEKNEQYLDFLKNFE